MFATLASATRTFPAKGGIALEDSYATQAGLTPYKTDRSVTAGVKAGKLVPVPIYSQPKLPEGRRFLYPDAAAFVATLDARFYAMAESHLILDSAVRSAQTQARVRRWNWAAAPAYGTRVSSHEFGTTFDLSKKVIEGRRWRHMRRGEYRWLLTQLQMYAAEGRVHVIEERACLHVMVRSDELSYVQGSDATGVVQNEILERDQRPDDSWRDFVVLALEKVLFLPGERMLFRCDVSAGTCRLLRESDRGTQSGGVDGTLSGNLGTRSDDSSPRTSYPWPLPSRSGP